MGELAFAAHARHAKPEMRTLARDDRSAAPQGGERRAPNAARTAPVAPLLPTRRFASHPSSRRGLRQACKMPTGERVLGQTCNTRGVVRPLAAQSGDEAPSQGPTCASVGVAWGIPAFEGIAGDPPRSRSRVPLPSFYAPWITMQNHIRSAKVGALRAVAQPTDRGQDRRDTAAGKRPQRGVSSGKCRKASPPRWASSSVVSGSCRRYRCGSSQSWRGSRIRICRRSSEGCGRPSEQVLKSIADVLEVSADTLYDQAGVPRENDQPSNVVRAIREDPKLTGRQRQALIEIYEAFVSIGARPRRG